MQLQVRKDNRRIDAYGDFPAGLSAEAAIVYDLMMARSQDEDTIRNQPGSKTVTLDGQGQITGIVVTAVNPPLNFSQEDRPSVTNLRTTTAVATEIFRFTTRPN